MTHALMMGATVLVDFDDAQPQDVNATSIYTPARGLSWEMPRDEILVPIRSNDGVLLAYSKGSYDRFGFSEVLIQAPNATARKALRNAILDALDLARFYHLLHIGDPVDYVRGLGDDDDPDIFEVVTGDWGEPTAELLAAKPRILQGALSLTCNRT